MAVYDLWHRRVDGRKVRTDKYGIGKRWQARWRDGSDRQHKKRFESKDAAEAFLARQRLTPSERTSTATVAEQYELWIAGKAGRKPSTLTGYRQKWDRYVGPRWGDVPLVQVRHSEVAAWLAGLAERYSASTARQAWTVFHGTVQSAVRDGALAADPCAGVELPKIPASEVRPLSPAEVNRLLDAAGKHRLAVEAVVTTGMRWGEMAGLSVGDVDVSRRRLLVRQNASMKDNRPVLVAPKSGRVRRVPVSADLARRLGEIEGEPGAPLFRTRSGGRWRYRSWHRAWATICGRAGVEVTTHGLRHTAASIAIASGANVKQLQEMLGHSTATLTLDTYGHLMGDDGLDDLAGRISGALLAPLGSETPSQSDSVEVS